MVSGVYSIFDDKAQAFIGPMVFNSPGLALRAFTDICNDKNHPIGKHPTDYSLFRIGEFDDSKGSIECPLAPIIVCVGREVIGENA